MKKLAIIGSGISGTSAAYYLKKKGYHITLFEANDYFGGHTNTVDIEVDNQRISVDTGFLVHNDRTYPHLIEFFKELNINVYHSEMGLSVQVLKEKVEWCGNNLSTLFLQKKNIFSPKFWKMLRDIISFNKRSDYFLSEYRQRPTLTLGDLLKKERYSKEFIHWYLIPMGAAIWSTPEDEMLNYPAFTFLNFCTNHGLLQVSNRPQWKTIPGGCRQYVDKVITQLDKTYLSCPVTQVIREKDQQGHEKVTIHTHDGHQECFDAVISAVHAPINLKMIRDFNQEEMDLFKSFKYQPNQTILHTDDSFLPRNKKGWASWNYVAPEDKEESVSVSYLINELQPLPTETPVIVTLNPHKPVNQDKVLKSIQYQHPLFNDQAIKAQKEIPSIQGRGHLYFTGAWQRYGFHEDGIWSAKRVIEQMEKDGF